MAGYLGAIPVPQATQHRESFTATSGQTSFSTAGYTPLFLDVYLNGSHLSPADFTATNGSDVVLASGASTGDVCDIISYTAFEVNSQTFTGTTTLTGNLLLGDNDKAIFGAGSDLQIYHDGSNSYIKDVGTGDLTIAGTNLQIRSSATNENFIYCVENGAVNLYHNDAQKLATTSTGIDVTGVITADSLTMDTGGVALLKTATDDNIRISQQTHASIQAVNDAANAFTELKLDGSSLLLNSQSGGNVGIGTSSPDNVGSTTALTINRASGNGQLSLMGNGTVYGRIFADNATGDLKMGNPTSNDVMFYTANTERMRIDSTGAVTMPAQPAFLAVSAANQLNIPASTLTTVVFGNEKFDQNADFASNTFTAPVTGKYQFNVHVRLENVDISAAYYQLHIRSSNEIVAVDIISPKFTADLTYFVMQGSILLDMDASDTAYVTIFQSGGAAQTDIDAGNDTAFSGYLVA